MEKCSVKQIQSNVWEFKLTKAWHGKQINHVVVKLNKSNAIMSKLTHVLNIKTLRSTYYAICEYHLCHVSLVWAQNTNSVKRLHLLKKTSLRITYKVAIKISWERISELYRLLSEWGFQSATNPVKIIVQGEKLHNMTFRELYCFLSEWRKQPLGSVL